jgi:hypothetical protein
MITHDEDRIRTELRSSLDEARSHFIQMLDSLSDEALSFRSKGSVWSVGEVATHVVLATERTPALIGALRRGHDYLNYPLRIVEPVKRIQVRWDSRGATREALRRRAQAAFPPIIQLLDTIRPEEWARGGRAYGEGYWTVEHALRHQREHVDEHIEQIDALLGRR